MIFFSEIIPAKLQIEKFSVGMLEWKSQVGNGSLLHSVSLASISSSSTVGPLGLLFTHISIAQGVVQDKEGWAH